MARSCTICEHPDRAGLDAALQAGESLRRLASSSGVSKTALLRHRDNHLRQAAPVEEPDQAAIGQFPQDLERADATPAEPAFVVLHDAIGAGAATFLRGEVVRPSDLGPGANLDRLLLLGALRPATEADLAAGDYWPAGVMRRRELEEIVARGEAVLYHGKGHWNDSRIITDAADLPADEEILADLRARRQQQGRTWTG